MSTDFRWTSNGGVLMDGSGDIALSGDVESLIDMVRTRLKADLNGWKLYRIGADLSTVPGYANTPELQVQIKRQVTAALQNNLLLPGSFTVNTVDLGSEVDVYVYLGQQLIARAVVDIQTGTAGVL